jgi:hypothetical protein
VTSAAFEQDAHATARQLAEELLDLPPKVVRRELAAYARRFPRRSGLVPEYAFEADACREGQALRRDADQDARLRRLLDAANVHGLTGQPASADDARHRTLARCAGVAVVHFPLRGTPC